MRRWKLCHTADWHLGHSLFGRSREHEHAAFLKWLVAKLEEEEVDALVVAGDVFDSVSPPGTAQGLFFEFLANLRARMADIDVVIVAGNHDSPARLAAPDPVLRSHGVRLVGGIPWKGNEIDASSLIVPVRVEDDVVAWIAAVPYLRACDLPPEDDEQCDAASRIARGTRWVYGEVIRQANAARHADQALILTGHCHLAGAVVSKGSERAVLGGLAGALPLGVFPTDASYVALGHLHLAQEVSGASHVRYSGSPIPLAFGEESYEHEVRIATFEGAKLVSQEPHFVPRTVPMLRVPREGPLALTDVLSALRSLELDEDRAPEEWPWLEVRVIEDRVEPALRARIEEAISGRPVRIVKFTVVGRGKGAGVLPENRRELAELDVRDVFLRRWALEHGGVPDEKLLAAFDEAYAAVQLGSSKDAS
jgi:exonuclease SbcD